MNVDFGDVDGNGFLDIYVTNILAPRYKTDEGNMLWLNLPDPASRQILGLTFRMHFRRRSGNAWMRRWTGR